MRVTTLLGFCFGIATCNIVLEGPEWVLWFFLSPLPFLVWDQLFGLESEL
jgi:hypothetical protein